MRVWRPRPLFVLVLLIATSLGFCHELSAQTTASGALAGVVID
jgi:hypothetical protein